MGGEPNASSAQWEPAAAATPTEETSQLWAHTGQPNHQSAPRLALVTGSHVQVLAFFMSLLTTALWAVTKAADEPCVPKEGRVTQGTEVSLHGSPDVSRSSCTAGCRPRYLDWAPTEPQKQVLPSHLGRISTGRGCHPFSETSDLIKILAWYAIQVKIIISDRSQ